ncbi:MAG: hypothetical protein ACREOC_11215 [Gemmatimonadales bacterium]
MRSGLPTPLVRPIRELRDAFTDVRPRRGGKGRCAWAANGGADLSAGTGVFGRVLGLDVTVSGGLHHVLNDGHQAA